MNKKLTTFSIIAMTLLLAIGTIRSEDSNDFNVTLNIGNNAPMIIYVAQTSPAAAITLVEGSTTPVKWTVWITDLDGYGDISTVTFRMTDADSTNTRIVTCSGSSLNSTTLNVTCILNIPYYFLSYDTGTTNATATDSEGVIDIDTTQTFTINELEAFTISPSTITFGTIYKGTTNQKATNDPIILNDTGNLNFGTVEIKGQNLISGINTFVITANMTASGSDICGDQYLEHNTKVTVASITIGRHTDASKPTSSAYFCADSVPSYLPIGSYVAPTSWVVYGSV